MFGELLFFIADVLSVVRDDMPRIFPSCHIFDIEVEWEDWGVTDVSGYRGSFIWHVVGWDIDGSYPVI